MCRTSSGKVKQRRKEVFPARKGFGDKDWEKDETFYSSGAFS